jgi:enoyl-CoA hydratase/carnithine racemase
MSNAFSAQVVEKTLLLSFHSDLTANALSLSAALELSQLIKTHQKNCDRLVMRSSHKRIFCSGGDLKFYEGLKNKTLGLKANRQIGQVLTKLKKWPGRTLAIVEGDCLGGGMELLSAFDEIWSTPYAQFAFLQRRLALSFGWGGYQRWQSRLPEALLKRLAISTQRISAASAFTYGLIDQIILPGDIHHQVANWKNSDANLSVPAGQAIKALSPANQEKTFASLWWSREHLSIIRSFLKR